MRVQSISRLLIIQLGFFYGSLVASQYLQERETLPAPIVIAPSQEWDGDDGSWSSFPIQVGTPPQLLRVYVSTALHQTSVVLPQGCIATDPTDCANLRGGEFKLNESSTWVKNTANLSTDIYPFLVGEQLGYTGKARLGFDDLTLDWAGAGGPSLKNQTIAGIATKDSYLGVLGLAPRASNFTSFNNPIPSLMQNLKNQSLIPSTSYGYTAGNQYRLNQVLGSLTLGGYDRSKFVPHGITWSLYAQDVRDLTVQIDAITSTTSSSTSSTSLLPKSIPAFLDSSLPYIWLPVEACVLFEKAFNLTWDNATELYTLTDAQHQALSAQNPNITFTLGNLTAGAQVNISLPYAAFDLTAVPPFVANTTKYFPLKRAANYTQYTLGRTFFQEAYVIADYDRGNFSVSQCSWVAGASQDIVAIRPVSVASTTNGTTGGTSNSASHSSSAGAIAGGVVGGLAVLAVAAFLLYRFCIKPRRHAKEAAEAATAAALAGSAEKAAQPAQDTTDPAFFKPELDASSPAALSEMEGQKMQLASVEAAGTPVEIYELPVDMSPQHELPSAEPMGAELPNGREAHEMHQPERFSWEATPVDGVPSQPPRWSWITTPGGAGPSASSEKDVTSPMSPPGPRQ
ncbi:aspartic peptidase domain-containing protein [Halenospora varia]|nr:aspartic peptidase domain-containing protein [Halenospora varia]